MENNEIKNEDKKFKQEKIIKPKKKTWKKVLIGIIVTLFIGIIIGSVGLYYLQSNVDWWFIIPSTLEIKKEETDKTQKDTIKVDEENIIENEEQEKIEQSEQQEVALLTMEEAYKKIDELYNIAIDMYLNYPASYFTIDTNSHPSTSETAVEVVDYDKVINKYFTKSAKADYEESSMNILIEENDVVYMEQASGVIGLDYLDRIYTKIQIMEDEIICEVDNIYNGSFDDMKLNSEGEIILESTEIKLEHVKSQFIIKKVNNIWKIEQFDFNGMR